MKIFRVTFDTAWEDKYTKGAPFFDGLEHRRDVAANDGEAAVATVKKWAIGRTKIWKNDDPVEDVTEKCVGFKMLSVSLLASTTDD